MLKTRFVLVSLVLLLAGCGGGASNDVVTASGAAGASSTTGTAAGSSGSTLSPSLLPTVLHAFAGTDGAWARGSLTLLGQTIYGRTSIGGSANSGTIFSIGTDGTRFNLLFSFPSGGNNGVGNQPHHNAMVFFQGHLLGAALYGGTDANEPSQEPTTSTPPPIFSKDGNGTIFTVGLDGSGYTPLHLFTATPTDGEFSHSPPVIGPDGVTLYGMTSNGGSGGKGALYSLNGTVFKLLHSFTKDTGDDTHGQVTVDSTGTLLLGMTRQGGANDKGVIFSYGIASGTYTVLHTFGSGANDGDTNDHGFLTRIGQTVYGVTSKGGANGKGIIFSMRQDGTQFAVLHSFGGGTDGRQPFGSLTLSNDWLYGTTQYGGPFSNVNNGTDIGLGTVFRYNPTTNVYQTIAVFNGAGNGAYPEDNVVPSADGTMLFGQTQAGGVNDTQNQFYYGTVFSFPIPKN